MRGLIQLRFIKNLIYGGGSIKPLEYSVILALSEALAEPARTCIRNQIDEIWLVQRENGNRMILFFFQKTSKISKVSDDREDLLMAKASFTIQGMELGMKIFFHRGRIRSLESMKRFPNSFLKENIENFEIEICSEVEKSLAEKIDREEH